MESIESEGKTVTQAVERALEKLGLSREQVEVQILQEPSGGFIGIGAKAAKVRVTEKHWGDKTPVAAGPAPAKKNLHQAPPAAKKARPAVSSTIASPALVQTTAPPKSSGERESPKDISGREILPEAETLMKELLGVMGLSAIEVSSSWDASQERAKISLTGGPASQLIGQDGKILESLQFIFNIILSRKSGKDAAVQVDAMGYWANREKEILEKVTQGVSSVIESGAPYRLPPMSASIRRMIHKTLADHPEVQTVSEGEGVWRKIVLRPRRQKH